MYFYFTRNFNFWKKHGIPYLKPTLFVGNLKKVFFQQQDINTHLKDIYNEHKEKPYVGIFSFDRPTLIVNDLELVKNILVRDSQNFVDHIVAVDEALDPLYARILFSLKGQKWRQTRVNVTPTFTSGKMKKMFYLVEKCAKELCDYLDRTAVRGK
jgi:cytochrome P450 family 6